MFLSRGDRDLGAAFQTHPGEWRRACKASRKCIFKVASEDRFKDLRLGSVMIRANLATVAFILETIGYHWKCCGRRIIQSDGS